MQANHSHSLTLSQRQTNINILILYLLTLASSNVNTRTTSLHYEVDAIKDSPRHFFLHFSTPSHFLQHFAHVRLRLGESILALLFFSLCHVEPTEIRIFLVKNVKKIASTPPFFHYKNLIIYPARQSANNHTRQ